MRKNILMCALVLSVCAVSLFSGSIPVANAQTTADLQAQISALMAQIAALQAQMGNTSASVSGAPSSVAATPASSWCVDLTSQSLVYRSRDTSKGGQVSQLQRFLKAQGYLSSEPTGYFGEATYAALKNFQRAHGLPVSGNAYSATRAKIKALSCGEVVDVTNANLNQNQSSSITVSSPRAGDVWYQGNSYTVSWTPFTGDFTHYQPLLSNRLVPGTFGGGPTYLPIPKGQSTSITFNASDLSNNLVASWVANSNGQSEQAIRQNFYYTIRAHKNSGINDPKDGPVVAQGTSGTFSILSQNSSANQSSVPTINSISPSSAFNNTTVTIYGSNLSGASMVNFYNSTGQMVAGTPVRSVASNSLTFTMSEVFTANVDPDAYQVKVITPAGTSNALNFTVSASSAAQPPVTPPTPPASNFTVTFPTSGATLARGSSQTVRWTGTLPGAFPGTSYSVYLVVPTTPAVNIYVTSVSPLQGSFNWTVPTDVSALSGYKFKFVGNGSGDGFSSTFTISGGTNGGTTPPPPVTPPVTPPVVPPTPPTPPTPPAYQPFTITVPAAGAVWTKGSGKTIQWPGAPTSEVGANYTVSLVSSSLSVDRVLYTGATGVSGALSMIVPSDVPSGSDYKIKISGYSSSANSSVTIYSGAFSIQ